MDTYYKVKEAFKAAYPGVSMTGIYCSITGKRIGNSDEIDHLVDSLEGDPEEIADDVAIRLFASMRPSMFWNKMNIDSLNDYRVKRPIETLAYLLNRLLTPPNWTGDLLAIHHDRIRLYQCVADLDPAAVKQLNEALLSVDARLNLNGQLADFTLDTILLDGVQCVHDWCAEARVRAAKQEKAREMETRWFRDGNTLAKKANVAIFHESKPDSDKKVKDQAKRKDRAFMDNVLAALMSDTATPDSLSADLNFPEPEPKAKPKGLSFLKKKDS